MQGHNSDDKNDLESNEDQDKDSSSGNTSSIYTYRRSEKQPRGQRLNQFGNGWNKEGRERFWKLMWDINESRAHFNQSFDKHMKIYAKRMRNKERNRQEFKQAKKIAVLPNDMMLPTVGDILKNHVQFAKLQLNEELMNHVDEYLDNNDSGINTE